MKFSHIKHYVLDSFEDKPSFVIVMEDSSGEFKEFISNGCVFVENTCTNIVVLAREYKSTRFLDELFKSAGIEISELKNGAHMFRGCNNLDEFSSDLSSLENGCWMFYGCNNLKEFSPDLSNLKVGSYMFGYCNSLKNFSSDLSSLENDHLMFYSCLNLEKFPR